MKCIQCGGTYHETIEPIEIADPYVGKIYIENEGYLKCENCDDILYTEQFSRKLEVERTRLIQYHINRFPLSDFLTASETAEMLGITKQALSKHKRISRGFVYHTKKGNLFLYLKQSVIEFIRTNDGRFPLYIIPIKYQRYHQELFTMKARQYMGLPWLRKNISARNKDYTRTENKFVSEEHYVRR